ncbi:MAG: long-chain fatty acid--CoA ligase [Deltaproteobacteria bacterium]|nr:long-chain fatty acid--CoA ligase [Deltaproteobacteria bacterium]
MTSRENSINEVFKNRVAKYGDRLSIRKKRNGAWESATWNEYYERARAAGLGFRSLGVEKGDRICILSDNRLEWLYSDMGGLGVGACIVPIYPTLTDKEVAYMSGHSESKVIVVENSLQLKKALHAIDNCPALTHIVLMNSDDMPTGVDTSVLTFADLMERGRKEYKKDASLFEKIASSTEDDDLATIVYTSGTTGVPKGAMITHKNIISVLRSLHAVQPPYAHDTDHTAPFLPVSHVYGRVADHFMGMFEGITSSYVESLDTVVDDIKEVRPHMVMAIPRVLEKIYYKTLSKVHEQPKYKRAIFYWGQKVGQEIGELREAKKPIPLGLRLKYKIAYFMIFNKLQDALGGRVRYITASGGPTAREVQLFFNAAGIMVVEGYGMTEATAPVTMSNLADYRLGTTGPPIPGLDVKIAEDGELLLKGDTIIKGYLNMEKETKNSFTKDGYFMTGDIGEFDDAGFLKITDRKKDLIVTAGGKNIAPQKIENLFLGDPIFSQFVVVGDQRKYLSALCVINLEQAEFRAKKRGIPYTAPEQLLENSAFLAFIDERVQERNKHLARFETIKKYRVLKQEFTPETGELTSSLKVKRRVVQEKHKELIDTMYE